MVARTAPFARLLPHRIRYKAPPCASEKVVEQGRTVHPHPHTCGVANSGEGAREAAMASELTSEASGLQMAASNPAEGGSDTVETNHSTSDEGATLGKSLSSSSLSTLSAKASAFVPQSVLRTYTR